jgi:hypothetical protein
MSGYVKSGTMSKNAAKALKNGFYPLYKITNKDLKEKGWKHTLSFARWLAEKGIWHDEEWHHTGRKFKKTRFYSIDTLINVWKNKPEEKQKELQQKYKTLKHIIKGGIPVSGYYEEPVSRRKIEFSGILKGATIYLDDGKKRKANGNDFWYKEET